MKRFYYAILFGLFALYSTFTHAEDKKSWYIDHVVIVVKNLDDAVKEFKKLGFTVIPGGKHADNFDHNALIPFSDGSYIELYSPVQTSMGSQLQELKKQNKLDAFTSNLNAIKARFIDHIASGEGIMDFAISAPHLNLQQIIASQQNQTLVGPIRMDRIRPDDKKIVWDVAVPKNNSLPFLITDITPKSWRTLKDQSITQQNGVTGIAEILIIVPDLKKAVMEYQIVLNMKPLTINISTQNVKSAIFKIGKVNVILMQPTDKTSKFYQNLVTRGAGPYDLTLYSTKNMNKNELISFAGGSTINLKYQ